MSHWHRRLSSTPVAWSRRAAGNGSILFSFLFPVPFWTFRILVLTNKPFNFLDESFLRSISILRVFHSLPRRSSTTRYTHEPPFFSTSFTLESCLLVQLPVHLILYFLDCSPQFLWKVSKWLCKSCGVVQTWIKIHFWNHPIQSSCITFWERLQY